jgi:SAM-dependent methyltransferase
VGWRAAAFTGVRSVARGLELGSHALIHAGTGLLRPSELRRVTTQRWQTFGASESFVDSGFLPWEASFYPRFLEPDDGVLLVGCGTGRDLLALLRAGYRSEGLEPAAKAAATARAVLLARGFTAPVHIGWIEDAPLSRSYDAIVFSWHCYSYLPLRATRVRALDRTRASLAPGGRILLSYLTADRSPRRRLSVAVTTFVARLSRAGWQPQASDLLHLESGGLHYEHQFGAGELQAEARDAGLTVVHDECDDDGGRAVLRAV